MIAIKTNITHHMRVNSIQCVIAQSSDDYSRINLSTTPAESVVPSVMTSISSFVSW